MEKTIKLISVVIIFVTAFLNTAYSQDEPNIQITKIKENFYRLTCNVPYSVNFLAYVTKKGILLVDAGQKQTGNEIKKVLETIAPGNSDVKILINTHAHIDHTGGNLALAGEPVIIGQEILRSTLRDYSYVLYEFPDNALPSVTFSDSATVYFGDEKIRIISVPGSHDATDVIVYFTNAGIVCVGDIFEGLTIPSIDAYTGNILNFPKVINKVISIIPNNVTIVSGHDKETNVETLKQSRDIIYYAAKIIKEEMSKGKDVATMKKENILKDWAKYENGFGGTLDDWIDNLAIAGPSKFRGSTAGELYKVLIKNNGDAAVKYYYELKRDYPNEYPFFESLINRIGYWLLSKGRIEDAIKIFELQIKEFPDSPNGYDSLAEAFQTEGKKELAIKNYEKSLQLDPRNKNAEEMLKQLRMKK